MDNFTSGGVAAMCGSDLGGRKSQEGANPHRSAHQHWFWIFIGHRIAGFCNNFVRS